MEKIHRYIYIYGFTLLFLFFSCGRISAQDPGFEIHLTTYAPCAGQAIDLVAIFFADNDQTPVTYYWFKNGVEVASYNDNNFLHNCLISPVQEGDQIRCEMGTDKGFRWYSNTLTVQIQQPVSAPTVSIGTYAVRDYTTGQAVFCPATWQVLTAYSEAETFEWYLNGTLVSELQTYYPGVTFQSGDVISVLVRVYDVCNNEELTASDGFTVLMQPVITPTVSISASSANICSGTSVTFTASPVNGGSSPQYTWKKNGQAVQTTSSNTYSTSSLANGDQISVVLQSSEPCIASSTATSNTIAMTVKSKLTPSVSVSTSANNICSGASVTFTASPVNGGSSPQYIWKKNGQTVQTSSSNKYTTSSLINGNQISVTLQSSESCVTSSTAASNTIAMTVRAKLTPSVSISTSSTNICAGTSATFTASPVNGGSSPQYIWKKNGQTVQTSSSNKYTTSSLSNGNQISVALQSSETCVTSSTATSNTVTVTVNQNVTPSVRLLASSTNICAGVPVTFTAVATHAGSSPQFRWKKNEQDVQTTSSNIFETYTLDNGNRISVELQSNAACATTSTATSNVLTMKIHHIGSSGQNYISERIVQNDSVFDASQITPDNAIINYTYFDGLGRPMQTVAVGASRGELDIVTPITYDAFGRQDKQYLPYVSTANNGMFQADAVRDQKDFYAAPPWPGIPADAAAFDSTVFEPSPLNRVLKQYGPGARWHSNNKANTTQYQTNAANEVRLWKITTNGASGTTYYEAGTLYKNITADEDGVAITEYTDLQGRVVRSVNNLDYITQYVYDDFGRLTYVMQPTLTATSFTRTQANFTNYIFAYEYDHRGRVVRKHIPGAGWTEIVYNKLDQPVLTQTAEQATISEQTGRTAKEWSFTKYDAHGRVVMTGTLESANTAAAWNTLIENCQYQWEERGGTAIEGYTNRSVPSNIASANVHQIHYYDTYKNYTLPTGYSNRTQGLPTEDRTRMLDSNTFYNSAFFYDGKGRVKQTKEQTAKGEDIITNEYDFTGRLKKSVRSLGSSVNIVQDQDYDHAGRPTDTWHTTGTGSKTLTARNEYNELGQAIRKNLHSANQGNTWLQEVDYSYNIRGWLTGINSDPEPGDAFFYKLYYTEATANRPFFMNTTYPRYNGNVMAVEWETMASEQTSGHRHAYIYRYNGDNWLWYAHYSADTTRVKYAKHNSNRYNETLKYNKNGNISTLQRNGKTGVEGLSAMDNLTYSYTGNRLRSINDAANAQIKDLGYKDNTTLTEEFIYDASGRLIEDKNKEILISYNHLNLPVTITKEDTVLTYTYLADGRRIRKQFSGQQTVDRYYINGVEFEGNTPKIIAIPEGRIRNTGSGWTYDYFIKDHLGNVRVVLRSEQTGTQTYMATMEEGNAATETLYFDKIEETRADRPYNYPDKNITNAKVAKVPGKSRGPSIMLKVMAGDTIEINAKAFYNVDKSLPGQGVDVVPALASAVAAIASGGTSALGEATQLAADLGATASQSVALLPLSPPSEGLGEATPESGIHFVLYNEAFDIVEENTGLLAVEDDINIIQTLATDRMVVSQSGYLEVYVNNEAQTPVYFDNLSVGLTPGMLVEENHYYPFGMLIAGLSSKAINPDEWNMYKYNAKELQTELNLNWLDYGARMYDPPIGRWMCPDPLSEKYYHISPYTYTLNNPIRFVDPDGRVVDDYLLKKNGEIELLKKTDDKYDVLYVDNGKGGKKDISNDGKINESDGLKVNDRDILPDLAKTDPNMKEAQALSRKSNPDMIQLHYAKTKSGQDALNVFTFAASHSNVEWSFKKFQNGNYVIGTLNEYSQAPNFRGLGVGYGTENIVRDIHSHPGTTRADFEPSGPDVHNAKTIRSFNKDAKIWLFMPKNPKLQWWELY